MRRPLNRENVEYIVVQATNTSVHQDLSIEDVEKMRQDEGFPDIGFHSVITRDGTNHLGLPLMEAGTHTPRFDTCSVGVLLIGGKTTRGRPTNNYTPEQKATLRHVLTFLTTAFPKASIVGLGELVGGTNPHFDVRNFYAHN